MSNPYFSIVIPTYNRAGFIRQAIESVCLQSFTNFEILVIDDGSTDDTEEVVSGIRDSRIKYVKKRNEERAIARNVGARSARGLYVNFFDSDDLLYPHHLQVAFDFISANPNPEIFHLGYDVKTVEGMLMSIVDGIDNINKNIVSGNMLSCNGVFIKRDVICANPFYEDRKLASLEDWELWIRMAAKFKIHSVNKVTSTVVQHDARSVVSSDTDRIKQKVNCFIEQVMNNTVNQHYFNLELKKAKASALTYAALHLAMSKASFSEILSYLWDGITTNPGELFKRRFMAILKLSIFK
jgi:glycosyltransferase involved in cell wall biosynthesis